MRSLIRWGRVVGGYRCPEGAQALGATPTLLQAMVIWLWSLSMLTLVGLAAGAIGRSWPLAVAFALALALMGVRAAPASWRAMRTRLLAGAAGVVGFSGVVAFTWVCGSVVGIAPRAPVPSGAGRWDDWLLLLVLAPAFEERLYRGVLLPALNRRFGGVAGCVLSSAAFALPHLEVWNVLGTFLAGLILGGCFLMSRDLGMCIGLHAGWNLSGLLAGVPPLGRSGCEAVGSGVAGALLLAVALSESRRLRESER